MAEIVTLDGREYNLSELTNKAQHCLEKIVFIDKKVQELTSLKVSLTTAKLGHINTLKSEILTDKGGFSFGED